MSIIERLEALRADLKQEQADAANPGPYLSQSEYSWHSGQEDAFEEAIDKLDTLIAEVKKELK